MHFLKVCTTTASVFCLKQTQWLVIVSKFLVCMITSGCHEQLLCQSPGTTTPFIFLILLSNFQFVLLVASFLANTYNEGQYKKTEQFMWKQLKNRQMTLTQCSGSADGWSPSVSVPSKARGAWGSLYHSCSQSNGSQEKLVSFAKCY